MIRKLLTGIAITFLLTVLGTGLYGWHLSGKVAERFSSRRWSIPSTVYTDTMLLYPGQRLNVPLFYEKLKRTGYREVPQRPVRRGELHKTLRGMQVFLKDLDTPWKKRAGFLVEIEFEEDTIASLIQSEDGRLLPLLEIDPEEITLFFGSERERRQLVSIEQVPKSIVNAVLAAEDHRFYRHWGIDPRGIARAVITNLRHRAILQGGSTITQQLAKNYFLTADRTLQRKFEELILTVIMEIMYSKDTILEIYLNEIYLGQKGSVAINGIGEAAYFYFGKPVQELSLAEAATIAGLIRAPNVYSPYVDKDVSRERRDGVLAAMLKNGWISAETFEAETAEPLEPVGYAVYGKTAPYFVDYLAHQLGVLYRPEDLATLGLSIYTTLDSHVQMAAEQALARGLHRLENEIPDLRRTSPGNRLQGAVIVMQPKTGYILAMVGGRNYGESQFNRITQARRQAGSAFKPFVFLAGLDTFSPVSLLSNRPRVFRVDNEDWEPKNFDPAAEEEVTFRQALEESHNLATLDLAMRVGLDRIVATAAEFGFSTPLKPYPSLALGAFEVIPLELARAYCVFAAGGSSPFPLALKAVADENGKVMEQRYLNIDRLISPAKAFIINSLLRGVVERGTARALSSSGVHWPVAGKTGTTNNYRDAWFIGYTPDILALVWVGFDNGDSIGATGARAALPIWAELINATPHHISGSDFRVPAGVITKSICRKDGKPMASTNCFRPEKEYFLEDNPPNDLVEKTAEPGVFRKLFQGITNMLKGE